MIPDLPLCAPPAPAFLRPPRKIKLKSFTHERVNHPRPQRKDTRPDKDAALSTTPRRPLPESVHALTSAEPLQKNNFQNLILGGGVVFHAP